MAESGISTSAEGGSSLKIVRGTRSYKCADYNVAWICALRDTELLAARVVLDEEHNTPPYNTQYDRNTYVCGKAGEHNVVLACLPSGRSGNVNAGHLTGPLFHTFPNIKITLLVGIGGGVPLQPPQDVLEDVYLGDVVIGWPGDGMPAVVQYDSGRWKVDGFEQRGSVDQPDWHLTQALDIVVSNHEVGQTDFQKSVIRLQKLPRFASRRSDEDKLFQATYKHQGDYYSQCSHCLPKNLVQRPEHSEARPAGSFKIHLGTIASGGAVVQDGELRDRLSRECNNARCFEMEAVGVTLNSRCLVIRGLADYADSHKNDVWKYVAAGNAAAFAKEFLLTIKASGLRDLSGITAVQTPKTTLPGTLSVDPDFVGRDDILKQMDENFTKSNRVALVGLGGIGKTQIAVQYSHNYRERVPDCHIFWVYGATRQSFDEAYKRIAKELEIPGFDDPLFEHRAIVPMVLDRKQTGPWVMIVDNADDYCIYFPPPDRALGDTEQSEYLRYCLPHGAENGGRLIITTRHTKVGEDILSNSAPIQVRELGPVDARILLRSKIPTEKWEADTADMLLKELDYIPLAITQAGAFVKRNKLSSLKFYLGKLCQFHLNVQDVLSYELYDARRQAGTPNAIFRTWQISYQQIQLDNTEAANMLSLMAVFDNQAIPRILLIEGDIMDIAEMNAIQVLLDFSLIKGDQQYEFFSMHPLQQLSTQNWLRFKTSRVEEWQECGLVILSKRMPEFKTEHEERRYACSVFLPHALIVVSYEAKRPDCRYLLLLNMSKYEVELGRYQDSYQHAVQSCEAALEAYGDLSIEALTIKSHMSITLSKLGKYDEGKKLSDEVKGIVEDLCKANKEDEAYHISSLGTVLRQENAGFAAIQQALDHHQAYYGMHSAIHTFGTQAGYAFVEGKYEESENLYRQALRKSTEFYGENHRQTWFYMSKFAELLEKTKRTAEAVQLHRQVALGRESFYGMEHPVTMESRVKLAKALSSDDNFVEAEVFRRGTVEYYLRTFGLEHQQTLIAIAVFLRILLKVGNFDEADGLRRIFALHEDNVSADVTSTLVSSYLARGNPLEAEQILYKGVKDVQERVGQEHPENIILWDNLAECLEKQEKLEAAEGYWRRSLELYERVQGENSVGCKHMICLCHASCFRKLNGKVA